MKKIIVMLLGLIFILTSVSCKKKSSNNNEQTGGDSGSGDNQGNTSSVVLGEYQKNLEILEGNLGSFISESIYQYVNASFLIEELGQIKEEDLKKPETIALLKDAVESWDDLTNVSALADYLLSEELKSSSVTSSKTKAAIKKLANTEESEAVKWAKAITEKYDSTTGNQKLKELASYMGTDAKRAYDSLVIAQDILNGEYAKEEERAEEWLAVLNATKTASKVGVYLCATAVTCGATGAVATATTLTTSQTAGIIINGVDCVLTLGSEGANIIYGEDATISKCLSTTADVYSKCNYVYGLFNKPETVGETIAFISDTTELVNSGVSYVFNVDPLGDGGQLLTKVIDSSSSDYNEQTITDLKLGGAYKNPATTNTLEVIQEKEAEKLVGDDLITNLEVENKEDIIKEFKEEYEEPSNVVKTDNGLSYKEKDGKYDYCYRNKHGYLDGEKVQYSKDGSYVVERRIYSNGILIDCKSYLADGTVTRHEYIDSTDPNTTYDVIEQYYDQDIEDDINYQKKGNKQSVTYRSVTSPDKETVDTWKSYGCSYKDSGYVKYVFYNRHNDTLIDSVNESINGETIATKRYETGDEGDHYLAFESYINEDGNTIKKSYYENGLIRSLRVEYPQGGSDGEEYEYGEDEEGSYIETSYYTNGEYVNKTKVYTSGN